MTDTSRRRDVQPSCARGRWLAGLLLGLLCATLLLVLAGALAGRLEGGERWYWRQAAIGISVLAVWAGARCRCEDLPLSRRVLEMVVTLAPLLVALALAEGVRPRGLLRGGAWLSGVLLLGLAWPRISSTNIAQRIGLRAQGLWGVLVRRPAILAVVLFALGAGISAARARHGIDPIGTMTGHDSFCYVLQARTFLEGRAANPVHPHWEFFQAYHVVTWPFYQAKYPPGYALTLAGGLAVGLGRYVPSILMGLAALGTFLVGRRLFGVGPGLLATAWLIVLPKFSFLGSWQMSNTAAVAVGIWLVHVALLSRESPRRIWPYLAAGALTAYFILLRPLDAVLFASPVLGVWCLGAIRRLGFRVATRRLLLTGAIGALGLVIMGVYNHAVTGRATVMPYSVHEREYVPDHPPLRGLDIPRVLTTPAQRPHQRWERYYRTYGSTFLPTPIPHHPEVFPARFALQLGLLGDDARLAGVLLAVLPLSLFGLRKRRVWALLALAIIFCVGYAVSPSYRSRYLWPVVPLILLAVIGGAAEIARRRAPGDGLAWSRALAPAAVALLFLPTLFLAPMLRAPGDADDYTTLVHRVRQAPGERKLVFLDYTGWHLGQEYVYNGPEIDADAIVYAHDLEERNRELMDYYPERFVYRYVVKDAKLSLVRPGGESNSSGGDR